MSELSGNRDADVRAMYGSHPFGQFSYSPRRLSLHPHLQRWIQDATKASASIEIGCGGGDWMRAAVFGGVPQDKLIGLDIARGALAALRRESFRVVEGSALNLPFPDGAFSHTLCYGVLHHTACPMEGLREVVRVTRDGGQACVAVSHWGFPLSWALHRAATPWRRRYWAGDSEAIKLPLRLFTAAARLASPALAGAPMDKPAARTLFMDQFMTPHVEMNTKRIILDTIRSLGGQVIEQGLAGHGTLFVMRFRVERIA